MKLFRPTTAPKKRLPKNQRPIPSETQALVQLLKAHEALCIVADTSPKAALAATSIRLDLECLLTQMGHQLERDPF